MRIVADTNVLVSGLIKPGGRVGRVVDGLRDGRYLLLYSRATLDELVDVLSRPWLKAKHGIREVDVESFLKLILLRGEQVVPSRAIRQCRDPKDDKCLELALSGRADFLVTGDADLRSMDPFEGIPVLDPARFLEEVETPTPTAPTPGGAGSRRR